MSSGNYTRLPGPIRISENEWIVVRDNPRFPKAHIRRLDLGGRNEHYRVVSFDLDPAARRLIGRYRSLEAANDAVLYDPPPTVSRGLSHGMQARPRAQQSPAPSTATHAIPTEVWRDR